MDANDRQLHSPLANRHSPVTDSLTHAHHCIALDQARCLASSLYEPTMMLLTAASHTRAGQRGLAHAGSGGVCSCHSLLFLCAVLCVCVCLRTGDVHEFDDEAEEAHDEEADGGGHGDFAELCTTAQQHHGHNGGVTRQHSAHDAVPHTSHRIDAGRGCAVSCVPLASGLVHRLTRRMESAANCCMGRMAAWKLLAGTSSTVVVPTFFGMTEGRGGGSRKGRGWASGSGGGDALCVSETGAAAAAARCERVVG